MKKLLLSSVAICGLTLAAPAMADGHDGGVKLDLGGFYKGYLTYTDQDTAPSLEERNLDWLQTTEIHFTGETVLDNGLTIGAHFEIEADNDDDAEIEESYAYFSGAWGRLNAGAENGAAYLLQVAAPSADSNLDGIRAYVQPVNYSIASDGLAQVFALEDTAEGAVGFVGTDGNTAGDINVTGPFNSSELFVFDYDDDVSEYSNKLTYLTPVFQGFQAGVSYAPENDDTGRELDGVHADDVAGDYGDTYEIALRYAGEFEGFGVTVGAGFTHSELEADVAAGTIYIEDGTNPGFQALEDTNVALDDRQSWNVGLDIDVAAFGLGVAYVEDDLGFDDGADRDTLVVGADYTNGPWKLGASYYNQDQEIFGVDELETDRFTGGVVYTYGPGMTFRGSISYIDHETDTLGDVDATSVLLGTQINF